MGQRRASQLAAAGAVMLAAVSSVAAASFGRQTTIELPLAGHLDRRCDIALDTAEGAIQTTGDSITVLVLVTCNYPGASELEVIGPTMNSVGGEPGSTTLTLLQLVSAEGLTRLTFELTATAGTAEPAPEADPEPTPEPDTTTPDAPRRRLFGRQSGTATLTPN